MFLDNVTKSSVSEVEHIPNDVEDQYGKEGSACIIDMVIN